MKIAIIIAGALRHCDVSSMSWEFPFEADFYLSTWDVVQYADSNILCPIDEELKNLSNIDFKDIHIESYEEYYKEYKNFNCFYISRQFYLINRIYEKIKHEDYNRVIVFRPDSWIEVIKEVNPIDELKLKQDSVVHFGDIRGVPTLQEVNNSADEETRNMRLQQIKNQQHSFTDQLFMFDSIAFKKFANIWPNVLFYEKNCPHNFLYNYFIVQKTVTNFKQNTNFLGSAVIRKNAAEYFRQGNELTLRIVDTMFREYDSAFDNSVKWMPINFENKDQ